MLFSEQIDFSKPKFYMDTYVPDLGEKVGSIVGNVQAGIDAVIAGANLLQSGDGIAIAQGMAGIIKSFTNFLKNKISSDAVEERESIANAQNTFIGPVKPMWMWRQPTGGPPASQAKTKKDINTKGSELLEQYNPGAVYIMKAVGWDVIRRSFRRTDLSNVFDKGQDLIWTNADNELVKCKTRLADYYDPKGCGYNPGEKIQLSAGTWPYCSGADVMQYSGVTAPLMSAHFMALHTPSSIHVQTDLAPIESIWWRWKSLTLKDLPLLQEIGTPEDGVYRTPSDQIFIQGNAKNLYVDVAIDDYIWKIPSETIQYVTDCFIRFFELRKAIIRDWAYLPKTVQDSGKTSNDATIKKLAYGMLKPENQKQQTGFQGGMGIKSTNESTGGGLFILGGAALAAYLFLGKKGK